MRIRPGCVAALFVLLQVAFVASKAVDQSQLQQKSQQQTPYGTAAQKRWGGDLGGHSSDLGTGYGGDFSSHGGDLNDHGGDLGGGNLGGGFGHSGGAAISASFSHSGGSGIDGGLGHSGGGDIGGGYGHSGGGDIGVGFGQASTSIIPRSQIITYTNRWYYQNSFFIFR